MRKDTILACSLAAAVTFASPAFAQQTGGSTAGSGGAAPSGSQAGARPTQGQTAVPAATANFLKQLAEGGMTEVQLAKMAEEKGTSDQIKQLARRIEADHTKSNAEVKAIAQKIDVTLPTTIPPANQKKVDDLQKLSGTAFDKAYAQQMVEDHQKNIALFKQHQKSEQADIQQFVTKTLPVLEAHLKMAQQASANIK